MHLRFLFAFAAALATLLPSAGTHAQSTPAPEVKRTLSASLTNTMTSLDDKRALSPGDQLSFRVIEEEEPVRGLRVTDSGEMEVPYIGRVPAAGKNCRELAYEIKGILEKDYFHNATVIVGLDVIGKTTSAGRIYVTGQVRSPGPLEIPADESFTVSKAILRAGGFAEYANKRKVQLTRPSEEVDGKPSRTTIDVKEIIEKGQTQKDPAVTDHDVIFVPERLFNF